MAIYLPKSVFIHVPKTGGTWIGRAFTSAGINYKGCAGIHTTPDTNCLTFAFIRHPITWMISYFNHYERNGFNWDNERCLDKLCKSNNFNKFWNNIISCRGIVNRFLLQFIGKYLHKSNFFYGKQETLVDDLVKILNFAGENFNEELLRSEPRIYVNKPKKLTAQQIDDFYESQKSYFLRWQYEKFPQDFRNIIIT